MKTINDYCSFIYKSGNLEDKLLTPPFDLVDEIDHTLDISNIPCRAGKILFSEKKTKIPRLEHLNQSTNRGLALHHFANHELMAIEIFAWALLKFQNLSSNFRNSIFQTLQDEQKHLKLYLERMKDFGVEFGSIPLNYVFLKFLPLMITPEKFSAIMSISLEGANLDHAVVYKNTFLSNGDDKSANIMEVIYRDEIKHVVRGKKILENSNIENLSFWNYYISQLDYPFTPRRAKGYFYLPFTREVCGFESDFIQKLAEYKDEFSNRKKEIVPKGLETWGIYTG